MSWKIWGLVGVRGAHLRLGFLEAEGALAPRAFATGFLAVDLEFARLRDGTTGFAAGFAFLADLSFF